MQLINIVLDKKFNKSLKPRSGLAGLYAKKLQPLF